MRLMGFTGWSGSGKTHLLARLIPLLRARGLSVATIKHAHHAFDIDHPGKDSYVHRKAGASEVLVASALRLAHIVEYAEGEEPPLAALVRRIGARDLLLVEGFKREPHPKIEVFRAGLGKPALAAHDATILALACDVAPPGLALPALPVDDTEAVARFVLDHALPLDDFLARTDGPAL